MGSWSSELKRGSRSAGPLGGPKPGRSPEAAGLPDILATALVRRARLILPANLCLVRLEKFLVTWTKLVASSGKR